MNSVAVSVRRVFGLEDYAQAMFPCEAFEQEQRGPFGQAGNSGGRCLPASEQLVLPEVGDVAFDFAHRCAQRFGASTEVAGLDVAYVIDHCRECSWCMRAGEACAAGKRSCRQRGGCLQELSPVGHDPSWVVVIGFCTVRQNNRVNVRRRSVFLLFLFVVLFDPMLLFLLFFFLLLVIHAGLSSSPWAANVRCPLV